MKTPILLALSLLAVSTLHAQTPGQIQTQLAALQSQVTTLKAQVVALQQSNVQKLNAFVTVDPNPRYGVRGPHIMFHDANVYITNGSGNTQISNGLGNLFIGYDYTNTPDSQARAGSHNLVIGDWNNFYSNAVTCIISGEANDVRSQGAVAIGIGHRLWGQFAVAVGGADNTITSPYAVTVGGEVTSIYNGDFSALVGGHNTTTATPYLGQFGTVTP